MSRIRPESWIDLFQKPNSDLVRKKFAEDIHDEMGQNITNISLYSALIRRVLDKDTTNIAEHLEKIESACERLSVGLRDMIWVLDPAVNTVDGLFIRLQDFGGDLFYGTNINFEAVKNSKSPPILVSASWLRHLSLIFKEALRNVLKHSQASKVILELGLSDRFLKITLSDDGTGYEQNKEVVSLSQGLNEMQQRARKIEGQLKIHSAVGKGTCILFEGKLSTASVSAF